MNNIKLVNVFWFTNPYKMNVMGMVKAYDTITKEYNYYVGFGRGLSEEEARISHENIVKAFERGEIK